MRSRPSSAVEGFTLIEVALAAGLVAALTGFGLLVSVGTIDAATFRSEHDMLIVALRTARGRALSGVGGPSHGVHFIGAGDGADCRTGARCYVIFAGTAYAPDTSGEVEIPVSPGVIVGWPASDPMFRTPDGSASAAVMRLTTVRSGRTADVRVNREGGIDYE